MEIQIPEGAEVIIRELNNHGFDAYVVGGCVRDSILGKKPDDWDITTSAKPLSIKKIFKRTIDTGIKHGTVTVLRNKNRYEVTTYRIDGEYEDNRHPKDVIFTTDLAGDLKRRDFTINAMAYNPQRGLIDAFGGMEDLKNRIIRCVGSPEERFSEDALRILRAVRFSAQLGFVIENDTQSAIRKLAPNLVNISAERIQAELVKLLCSQNPHFFKQAYELGITKVILPEFDDMMITPREFPYHTDKIGEHALHSLQFIKPEKIGRLSMLLHDVGKPAVRGADAKGKNSFIGYGERGEVIVKGILKRLKFDNDTVYKVSKIIRWHDYPFLLSERGIRRGIYEVGEDIFPYLFRIKRADIEAQNDEKKEERKICLERAENLYKDVIRKNQCVSLKTLHITGNDLIELGIGPGKEIGILLKYLLETVIDNTEYNKKEILLTIAKNRLEKI